MQRTIRVLRAIALAGAGVMCWLVSGAAQPEAGQAEADIAQRLGVSHFVIQDLVVDAAEPAKQVTARIVIDGRERQLVMKPHSVCAPDMVAFEQLADGTLRYVEPPLARTYRGSVEGETDSLVAATVNEDGTLSAVLWIGDEQWGIQPLREVQDDAPAGKHVVYRQEHIAFPPGACGVTEAMRQSQGTGGGEGGIAGSGISGGVQADIAFDADFEYYLLNGSSTPNVISDITGIMNAVDATYERELGISFRITATIVRTAEPDPYSATTGSTLLNQFQQYWNINHGNINRDLAELMTGKTNLGPLGIAFLGAVCTGQNGGPYSVVQSRFSLNFVARVSVSTHEIGHNFSANHCDGAPDCGLMCSTIGSCTGNLTGWGPSASQIISWRNSFPCQAALSPIGACCVGATCTQITQSECVTAGGIWTANTPCTTRISYSVSPNAPIPNNNLVGVTSTITVADDFPISDLNIRLNIPHTWVGDLIVELQHNNGPFVRLVDRIGVPLTTFGCDSDNLNVWLDDQAVAGSIDDVCGYGFPQFGTGVLPSSGPAFKPNVQGAFNGQNALGFWRLRVLDVAANNVGTLASWTVNFEDANGDLCDPQGACCVGSACTQTGQSECITAGGTWTAGQACFDSVTSTTIPNLPIPDNNPTGVSHVLNVGTAFQIADLNLRLVINHSWVGDLVVRLSHAGGPFVTVIDRPGVPATAFGCDGNNYDIILDDEGASPIENLCGQPNNPPSPPNYTPNNPLSFFDGQNVAGQWTLNVNDMDIGDIGTLVQWSLVAQDSETGFCVVLCPANIVNTGASANRVDVDDLLAVISGWGDCPAPPTQCPANIVNTGTSANRVDVDDLLGVISAWGQCP